MRHPPIKVYAAFFPASASALAAVKKAGEPALGHDDADWLFLEGEILRISWEGVYFPLEEVLAAFSNALLKNAEGRLDYLDMEEWSLTRHLKSAEGFQSSTRDLNQILEYSGY